MIRIAVFAAALAIALIVVWAAASHFVAGPASPIAVSTEPVAPLDVARYFPDRDENETATRLLATVAAMNEDDLRDGQGRSLAIDYIRREVASPAAHPDPPPRDVAAFLQKNAQVIQTLRALLASNPPPVWKQRANEILDRTEPQFALVTLLLTLFAADALAEQSRGNTAAAWTDVGAIWVLTQSLRNRPEMYSMVWALTGSRMLNAVATKLPAPPPPWWKDFLAFHPRPALLRAMQYEAWTARTQAERYPVGEPEEETGLREAARRAAEPLVRPIRVLQAGARVRDARAVMRILAVSTPCDVMPKTTPGLWSSTVRRMHRFLIEREGVARLMELQQHHASSGVWPERIDDRSACVNARWIYTPAGNGMELAFDGTMAPVETRIVTPLKFRR